MVNNTILIGSIVFMFLVVSIGIWAGRQVKSSKSFFLAGGDQGMFPIIATQAATAIGGGCMIGWVGFGYMFGWGVSWYGICCIIGYFIVVQSVGTFFQKKNFYTIPDWICYSLGEDKWVRGTSAILAIWLMITAWSANAVATGTIVNQLTGLPVKTGALVGGLLILAYCTIGGMQSVIKVDMVNFIILWLGIIILMPATIKMAGGFSAIVAATPPENFNIWPGAVVGFAWLIALVPGMMTMQTVYQRFSASKSVKVAKWGVYGTIISIIFISIYASVTGMALRVINPDIAPQLAVPWFASNQIHPILGIFILGGILAALFSTSDSVLNSASSNIAKDFYKGIFNQNANDKEMLKAGRIATVIIGILGIIIALYVPSIMKLIIAGYSISAGGLLFPMFLAHFWKGTTKAGVLAGMMSGFVIVFPGTLIPSFGNWIKSILYNPTLAALLISLILTVLISILTKTNKNAKILSERNKVGN